jgi:hypothetical protein
MDRDTIISVIAHPMILPVIQGIVATIVFEIGKKILKIMMDNTKFKIRSRTLYLYVLISMVGINLINILFSGYEVWSRYWPLDKSLPATTGDVMFLSSHIGGIFLNLSIAIFVILLSNVEKRTNRTMDWLCTVHRCPGCDVQIDSPVWTIKR